jgi:Sec-independent protein translocase protein TatA
MFGMTRGEIGLVAFIFLLVYGAIVLPRLAERLGKDDAG